MSDIKEKTCVMKYFLLSIIYYKERLKFFKYQTNLQAITNNNTSIILSHYITSQQCVKSESGNVTSYINQEIKNSCQFNFNISNFSLCYFDTAKANCFNSTKMSLKFCQYYIHPTGNGFPK